MPPKVLVVDDSALARRQIGHMLADYDVIEACDGFDAFGRLREHPDIRLVVCDVNMPRMGGRELIEVLRASPYRVPVVILTAEPPHDGGDGARWLQKPVEPTVLAALASSLVSSSVGA